MHIPDKAVHAHKLLSEVVKACRKTCFIWDSNVFYSFVKEMKYFAGLNLISETDLIHLKNELELLLHELEQISAKGEFSNGNKVAIYLSNKKDFQISLLRVYSINSMDSQSPRICGIQKDWIQSLKRHSTLISESGESQRITFLEQQKSFIDTL